MKKYSFRLEQVRRVRKTQEDIAKAHLQDANNEVLVAQALVATRIAEYDASNRLPVRMADRFDFAKHRQLSEFKYQAVLLAEAAEQAKRVEAEEKRVAWAEAAMKVKVLDRLDERKREEYAIEFGRETDKEIDDIVTSRVTVKQ